ncbi:MAG: hypothetical protein HYS43_01960 [Candidatus Liptonbacteria bacterium]|nr:hypothetical protein [Candidatus Liptonbacteria bacterium]
MRTTSLFLCFAALVCVVSLRSAEAQESPYEFFVTWRAASSVPVGYEGKTLAAKNAPLTVSFELLSNGTPIRLTGTPVRWYVNGDLHTNASGTRRISYVVQTPGGGTETIRIQLPDYNGQFLETVVQIPVARPTVIISTPHPFDAIPRGETIFQALPFFFTARAAADLLFSWEVNGQRVTGAPASPDMLAIDTPRSAPANARVSVFASIRNKNQEFEIGTRTRNFSLLP